MSTGYSAATVQSTTRCDISRIEQVLYIAYTVFVYGHIQSVGVTAYRIYNNVHIVKLKRWGQMLRIIGNSWKKTAETRAMMSMKYINREKILFS